MPPFSISPTKSKSPKWTDYISDLLRSQIGPDGRYQANDFSGSINAFPNPSSDGNVTLTFDMKVDNEVSVRILSADGKLIYKNEIFCPANSYTELPIRLDENSANAGMYFLQVIGDDAVVRRKLMVMRRK